MKSRNIIRDQLVTKETGKPREVQHFKLPNSTKAEEMKGFWKEKLAQFSDKI